MRKAIVLCAFAFTVLAASPLLPQSSSSGSNAGERKRIAVFTLGRPSRDITLESLGRADREIRKVVADSGRFAVIRMPQSLSPEEAADLAESIVQARSAGLAERSYRFGNAVFTETEFEGLLGASFLAVPLLSELDSSFDETAGTWETDIEASVLVFELDASSIAPLVARVESSGFDGTDREKSASEAVEAVPMLLQFELRKLEAFRSGARVISVSEREVELGIGGGSGVRKGDEYALLAEGSDEEEAGPSSLVTIENTEGEASRGRVLYSSANLREGARLVEVPRLGVDFEPYLRLLLGRAPDLAMDRRETPGSSAVAGLRVPVSRGFFGIRPYMAIQVPAGGVRGYGSAFLFPLDLLVGAEYRAELGRLSLVPYCGAGVGFVYASETIYGESANSSKVFVPHIGGHAYLHLAFLASRDIRLFAELGGEYWISTVPDLYTDYGGVGLGAGVSIKL
jgi:hypothetical protein